MVLAAAFSRDFLTLSGLSCGIIRAGSLRQRIIGSGPKQNPALFYKNLLTNKKTLRIIHRIKINTSKTIEAEKVLQRALTESGEAEKPQNALHYMGR
jgi:hypothetical protein